MSVIDFKFEFGRVNQKLAGRVQSWINHEDYKGYVIVGPIGSGKSLLLEELKKKLNNSFYMHGYEAVEELLKKIKKEPSKLQFSVWGRYDCIFIDHLDDVAHKDITIKEFKKSLKELENDNSGKKKLIICTFVDEKEAKDFADSMDYELIVLKHVKPNLRIVKEKAKEIGVKIPTDKIKDLANLDTMDNLKKAFGNIEKDNLLKKLKK